MGIDVGDQNAKRTLDNIYQYNFYYTSSITLRVLGGVTTGTLRIVYCLDPFQVIMLPV